MGEIRVVLIFNEDNERQKEIGRYLKSQKRCKTALILILDNVTNGIIILVFAFLVSPMGLPMVAAWMIGQMQRFRYFVQDAIYG